MICLVEDDNSLEDEISTKLLLEWSLLLQLMLKASYLAFKTYFKLLMVSTFSVESELSVKCVLIL